MSAFAPRPATGADLDGIMAIERASFPDDAWSEASMRADVESPHTHYVVLEEAGRIVGYAGLRAVSGSRDADVQTIAVSAASRTRGRGRTLLVALLSEAHTRGVREVFLDVRADNPVAQALYVSEGFVEVGRRPGYYQPADVDAVVMRLDLPAWAHATRGGGSEIGAPSDAVASDPPIDGGSPSGGGSSTGGTDAASGSGSPTPGRLTTDAGACT